MAMLRGWSPPQVTRRLGKALLMSSPSPPPVASSSTKTPTLTAMRALVTGPGVPRGMGAGLPTAEEAGRAAPGASRGALEAPGGGAAGLAGGFAPPHPGAWGREVLDAVHPVAAPARVMGCVGESVVGGAREVET